ncbi:MAG: HEAT repeat domain-containing protein [Nannocystaceae bacterium]|nr:HEAT repeat domain-containing protein [Nannocystaceae bacterium]
MDSTWPDSAAFACHCGTMFSVMYWRWVDAAARPDLDTRVQQDGPFEGICPDCGAHARCAGTWLRIDARVREASLQVGEAQRGSLLGILRGHLRAVESRSHAVRPWMLQPTPVFYDLPLSPALSSRGAVAVVPARSGELVIEVAPASRTLQPEPRGASMPPGVPQIIGSDTRTPGTFRPPVLGAYVGDLSVEGEFVVATAMVDASERDKWEKAHVQARPILLRGHGYPLLGVRTVASFLGQKAVLDAVLDPADAQSAEVFRLLANRFTFQLRVRPSSGEPVEREAVGEALEPNAALCLESARTLLASEELPPERYHEARAALAVLDVNTRLTPPPETITAGAYQHVVGAAEASAALDHLDRVSTKPSLARLLEVEGLPMTEYDAVRRRVLEGSLDHGLVAPRRFWRRVVASGLVPDLETYAQKLCEARAEFEGEEGDLELAGARMAWEAIGELCSRKDLPFPPALRAALGLADSEPRPSPPPIASAPPADPGAGASLPPPPPSGVEPALHDPTQRLKIAAEVLQGKRAGDLEDVFAALDEFDNDELLALLPDLNDMGPQVVPHLLDWLSSPRRELRQAAAILLGLAQDPTALEPLAERLVTEDTTMWSDVARALGAFGPTALRRLCQVLRHEDGAPNEHRTVERVARALAEVALSDGQVGPGDPSPGTDAVAALADAGDPRVRASARHALATLQAVSDSSAAVRGEAPLPENTQVRGFSRRAYEAIMVPEVEVEAEA